MTDMNRDRDAGASRAAQDHVLGFDDGGEFALGIDAGAPHLVDPVAQHEARIAGRVELDVGHALGRERLGLGREDEREIVQERLERRVGRAPGIAGEPLARNHRRAGQA